MSGGLGLAGAVIYGMLCQRLSLRPLLALGIACSVASTCFYLFYRSGAAAILIEGGAGFFATLAELPLMDLAARATPRGEGLGFALMMAVRSGSQTISDSIGSFLIGRYHVSFFHRVWLNAGTTALVLPVIPFLPRVLMDRRDGQRDAAGVRPRRSAPPCATGRGGSGWDGGGRRTFAPGRTVRAGPEGPVVDREP